MERELVRSDFKQYRTHVVGVFSGGALKQQFVSNTDPISTFVLAKPVPRIYCLILVFLFFKRPLYIILLLCRLCRFLWYFFVNKRYYYSRFFEKVLRSKRRDQSARELYIFGTYHIIQYIYALITNFSYKNNVHLKSREDFETIETIVITIDSGLFDFRIKDTPCYIYVK